MAYHEIYTVVWGYATLMIHCIILLQAIKYTFSVPFWPLVMPRKPARNTFACSLNTHIYTEKKFLTDAIHLAKGEKGTTTIKWLQRTGSHCLRDSKIICQRISTCLCHLSMRALRGWRIKTHTNKRRECLTSCHISSEDGVYRDTTSIFEVWAT